MNGPTTCQCGLGAHDRETKNCGVPACRHRHDGTPRGLVALLGRERQDAAPATTPEQDAAPLDPRNQHRD